jgi:hypothetical protein
MIFSREPFPLRGRGRDATAARVPRSNSVLLLASLEVDSVRPRQPDPALRADLSHVVGEDSES